MRMYVRVMAAVIACILLSGEALSAFAITPATENLSWFKKKKKKPSNNFRWHHGRWRNTPLKR